MAKAVLFDFDGTIADSEWLILESLNTQAARFGFEPIRHEEIPALRRFSMQQLVTQRLSMPLWNFPRLLRLERAAKAAFEKRSSELQVFAGMAEVVAALRAQGYLVGVVSSAPELAVCAVLERTGIEVDFVRASIGAFGKARVMRAVLTQHGVARRHALYVGDELRDIEATKRARIGIVCVGWGLNDAATLRAAGAEVASTPEALLAMITARV